MGMLDFLFNKEKAEERKVAKLKKTLTHMYVQPPERQYAISALAELCTPDAVRALLARFNEAAPNSTVDSDEKKRVYEVLVDLGRHGDADVVTVVREFLDEAEENITWPLKVANDLMDRDQMSTMVAELLEGCGTDYQRTPEKKQELILRAADFDDEAVTRQVARFVKDDNDTIRFLAVETLLNHTNEDIIVPALREMFPEEDSVRILNKLAEAFANHQTWTIPESERENLEELLPEGFGIHKKGHIYRRRT